MTPSDPAHSLGIRDATDADFPAILVLNTEWVHFTSPLDEAALSRLHSASAYHRVVASGDRLLGFLLALPPGTDYASPNYRWFEERGDGFLYVDRVIVDASAQGQGVARMLYDDLIAFARASGVVRIVCELDVEPPNAASARFHDAYGFREVGTQWVAGGSKRVSLRELTLE